MNNRKQVWKVLGKQHPCMATEKKSTQSTKNIYCLMATEIFHHCLRAALSRCHFIVGHFLQSKLFPPRRPSPLSRHYNVESKGIFLFLFNNSSQIKPLLLSHRKDSTQLLSQHSIPSRENTFYQRSWGNYSLKWETFALMLCKYSVSKLFSFLF